MDRTAAFAWSDPPEFRARSKTESRKGSSPSKRETGCRRSRSVQVANPRRRIRAVRRKPAPGPEQRTEKRQGGKPIPVTERPIGIGSSFMEQNPRSATGRETRAVQSVRCVLPRFAARVRPPGRVAPAAPTVMSSAADEGGASRCGFAACASARAADSDRDSDRHRHRQSSNRRVRQRLTPVSASCGNERGGANRQGREERRRRNVATR